MHKQQLPGLHLHPLLPRLPPLLPPKFQYASLHSSTALPLPGDSSPSFPERTSHALPVSHRIRKEESQRSLRLATSQQRWRLSALQSLLIQVHERPSAHTARTKSTTTHHHHANRAPSSQDRDQPELSVPRHRSAQCQSESIPPRPLLRISTRLLLLLHPRSLSKASHHPKRTAQGFFQSGVRLPFPSVLR